MNTKTKPTSFLLTLLLIISISSLSQNKLTTRSFKSGKDVFGTRAFIKNNSQFENSVKSEDKILYAIENGEEKIYFTAKGLIYKLIKKHRITHEMHEAMEHGEKIYLKDDEIYIVKMNWDNANPDIKIEEIEKQKHYFTYGDSSLNSETFKKIIYKNVYNGIDFEYTVPENKTHGIKYNVILHPGANPNDIKMLYTGDVKKISLTNSGDIIIKTPVNDITEHTPLTFYKNHEHLESSFHLNSNCISFRFPKGYDNSKTLIIDPWITTISNFTGNNFAFDIDYDFSGNAYVYGGNNPFKVSKYDTSGILQWTFSGTVPSINWATGAYPGNFVVNKSNGKIYIGQGYIIGGTTTIRISNSGNYDNFITASNPNWNECWDMGFHCLTGNIYAFGGGQSGNLAAGIINQINASVIPTAFFPDNPVHGQDIASHAIDDQGNVFVYYSQGTNSTYLLNNRIVLLNPTLTGVIWNQPSTYTTLTECQNKNSYTGANIVGTGNNTSNGFNCLAVNSNYLFFYDGFNLAAYNKTSGAKTGYTTIPGNSPLQQGGIAVDDCNNVYIGGRNNILIYHFSDSTFNANGSITLGDTISPDYVFDIRLEKANSLLYVAGSGFIGTYKAISCNSSGNTFTQNIKVCKGGSIQLNTQLSSSYSWYGPNGFTSSQQNPFLNNVTSAMAGTYSVITLPSFCSSSTLGITNVKVDSLNVSMTANPLSGYAPLFVQFDNTTILNNTAGFVTANWNYGNGLNMTNTGTSSGYIAGMLAEGNTIYQSAGDYSAYLLFTQKTGTTICSGTAKILIHIELPSKAEVPNTFTPNGDGVNDNFILSITNIKEITCQIYDRWGVKMHDITVENGNISWDGKNLSGKDVPAGTYFYILTAKGRDGKTNWVDDSGKEIKQNGTISLFR